MQRKKFLSMALLAVLILSSNGPLVEAESNNIATDINEIENSPISREKSSKFTWSDPRNKFNVFENMNELYDSYGVDLVPESYQIEGIEPDYIEGKYLVFENINPLDIKVRYENVANYRGQDLDVLFTITNYTEGEQTDKRIKLGSDELRLKTDGYLNTEYEMKIVEHGSEQEVPVTFIMKIGDIDVDQYMGIKQFNEDFIGVSNDTNLSYSELSDYFIFGNYPNQILDSYAPSNAIVYYDKSSIIQGIWGLDRTASDPMNNVYTNFHIRLAPEPNTIINKIVSGNGDDQITQLGETLEYQIEVKNTSGDVDALDVPVRDSLLENPPEYLQFNDDIQISDGLETTGNLQSGDYHITNLPANSSAIISYSMTLTSIPEDVEAITNIVTDNGKEPNICEELDHEIDCDETITPIAPLTTIIKSVSDDSGDGIAQVGEQLFYTIKVSNGSTLPAKDVPIRDSQLENIPEYLEYNDDLVIYGSEASGEISNGTLVLNKVGAKDTVELTYSMTLTSIPEDVEAITNIVTDNGKEPNICEELDHEIDCDETTTPVEPNINIPEIELPEIELPEIELPEIELPEIELPEIELPEIVLPEIEVPCLDITCEDKVCSDNNENEKEVENETDNETIKNTSQQYHVNLCVAIIILLCGLLILRKYV